MRTFTVSYNYGTTRKYRTYKDDETPMNFDEAERLYYRMLNLSISRPELYSKVDCDFKDLLES